MGAPLLPDVRKQEVDVVEIDADPLLEGLQGVIRLLSAGHGQVFRRNGDKEGRGGNDRVERDGRDGRGGIEHDDIVAADFLQSLGDPVEVGWTGECPHGVGKPKACGHDVEARKRLKGNG